MKESIKKSRENNSCIKISKGRYAIGGFYVWRDLKVTATYWGAWKTDHKAAAFESLADAKEEILK